MFNVVDYQSPVSSAQNDMPAHSIAEKGAPDMEAFFVHKQKPRVEQAKPYEKGRKHAKPHK